MGKVVKGQLLVPVSKFSSNTALFEDIVSKFPHKVALTSRTGILTYYDLNARSNQLAAHLRSVGIGQGHVVAIDLDRSIQYVIAALAVWKAGAIYLPCEPSLPTNRFKHMITDSQAVCLIGATPFRSREAVAGLTTLCIDHAGLVKTIKAHLPTNFPSLMDHDSIAYIIYTSGSTGNPKGVTITHGSILNLLEDIRESKEIEPTDHVLLFSPFTFDASIRDIHGALLQGATLYVPQQDEILPGNLLRTIANQSITNSVITPSVPRSCTFELLPHLRTIVLAGEVITEQLIITWGPGRSLINAYGPSEATVCGTKKVYIDGILPDHCNTASIGKPILNTTIDLLDTDGNSVEHGGIGEICITGPGVSRYGYLNNRKKNEECFKDNCNTSRSYKTGDVGRLLPGGEVEYLGRRSSTRQVKLHGQRIELEEIERILHQDTQVLDAAVVLVGVEPSSTLRAYVVPSQCHLPDGIALRAQLFERLRRHLPVYALPSTIDFIPSLPLSANNKLDLRALAHLVLPKSTTRVRPLSELEQQIAAIMSDAMKLPLDTYIAPSTTYADLGGTSLLAALVLRRLNQNFSCNIPFTAFFRRNVTIQQIAELVREVKVKGSDTISNDLSKRIHLPADITYATHSVKERAVSHLLLTGATGFLGSHILVRFLTTTNLKVTCVVRAQSPGNGINRIRGVLESWGIWEESFTNRLDVVRGDVSKPFLGMDTTEYIRLAGTVDTVCHSAAAVSFIASLQDLEQANVDGTVEILRFATAITQKRLTYISSLAVFFGAQNHLECGMETPVRSLSTDIATGYAQSKWVSEQLVLDFQKLGGRVLVLRPGRLLGSTRHHKCPMDDLNMRLIGSILELGVAPKLEPLVDDKSHQTYDWHLDLTPADFCAEAVTLWTSRGKTGIHHIINQENLTYESILTQLETMGAHIQRVAFRDWQKLIPGSRHLAPLAPVFCDSVSETDPRSAFEILLQSAIFRRSAYASAALDADFGSPNKLPNPMDLLTSYVERNMDIFKDNRQVLR